MQHDNGPKSAETGVSIHSQGKYHLVFQNWADSAKRSQFPSFRILWSQEKKGETGQDNVPIQRFFSFGPEPSDGALVFWDLNCITQQSDRRAPIPLTVLAPVIAPLNRSVFIGGFSGSWGRLGDAATPKARRARAHTSRQSHSY